MKTVALLFMKEEIDFSFYPQVTPICLPEFDQSKDRKNLRKEMSDEPSNCSVSGWGLQQLIVSLN